MFHVFPGSLANFAFVGIAPGHLFLYFEFVTWLEAPGLEVINRPALREPIRTRDMARCIQTDLRECILHRFGWLGLDLGIQVLGTFQGLGSGER